MNVMHRILTAVLLTLPLGVWAQGSVPDHAQLDKVTASAMDKKAGSFSKLVLPLNNHQQAALDYQQALRALGIGNVTQTKSRLISVLKHEPKHIAARQLLASILLHRQQLDQAQRVLLYGVQLLPRETAFSLMLARLYGEQGHPERGIALLEKLDVPASLRIRVDSMLAALYQRVGRYDDAITVYRSLLRRDPRQPVWWLGLAMSLEASHRPANALTAYRQARIAKPGRRVLDTFIAARIAALTAANETASQS